MAVELVEVASGVWHARAKHVGWLIVTEGDEVTLVDTGYPGDRNALFDSLAQLGRSPADVAAVLLTHAHPDHLGSAEHLRTTAGSPVWAHEAEAGHARGEWIEQVSVLTLLRQLWRRDVLAWVIDMLRLDVTRAERVGEVHTFTDRPLDVPGRPVPIPTPGHTRGHAALHFPERGVLHVGDLLMTAHPASGHVGPQPAMPFFDADHEQSLASLDRIAPLAAEVVTTGHGPAFHGKPAEAVRLAREL